MEDLSQDRALMSRALHFLECEIAHAWPEQAITSVRIHINHSNRAHIMHYFVAESVATEKRSKSHLVYEIFFGTLRISAKNH